MELHIDKGMLKSLKILSVVLAFLGVLYIALYIWGIIGGTIFFAIQNGTTIRDHVITGESFTAENITAQQLANFPLKAGTLRITNASTGAELSVTNFTVTNANASVLLNTVSELINGTSMLANYTYQVTRSNPLDVTTATDTYLSATEADFFLELGNLRNHIGTAISLLALVIILLLFGGIFKGSSGKKEYDGMSY